MKILTFFTYKIGRLPAGIWFAWAALAFSAGVYLNMALPNMVFRTADIFAFWPVTIAAAVALFKRRLIARTFSGMSYILLLYHCIAHREPLIGIILAPLGFLGLIVNRRWFDEHLPRIGW